jgi:2',3'-cyclic-nucleotide 2'-phosphodiesterase (5'-nucleotidase family)
MKAMETSTSKKTLLEARRSSGGRAPGSLDKVDTTEEWQPTPCEPGEARLTVIQITDTYSLEHLASVKTLLADVRAKSVGSKVISLMTGDFLAPYLLSSVDRGQGMMNALAKIPIDYITWGNHEVSDNEYSWAVSRCRMLVIFSLADAHHSLLTTHYSLLG